MSESGAETDIRASERAENLDSSEEYERLMDTLQKGINQALYKLDGDGRIRDPKIEQARAKYLNTLAKLVKEYRMILTERDREELAARVEVLEEQLEKAEEKRQRVRQ